MATFAVNSMLEGWLQRMGVPYEYKQGLRYDQLAKDWNVINHGRPDGHPKEEALIIRYADAMQGGAVFPSPVIAKKADGYEVLDGCQRLCAADLNGQTIFNAYVIKAAEPAIRESVRICANAVLNGSSPSQEWTIGKVVDVLFEQFRFSVTDCHLWSGFPEQRIQDDINARDARRWMESHNIDVTRKPANQKGFQAAIAAIPKKLREEAASQVRTIVENCQAAKANNSEAVDLVRECTDIKVKHGVHPRTQLNSKIVEVFSRPDIKARMQVKTSQHPVDNAIRAMTGAVTALRNAQAYHADFDQSTAMVELMSEIRSFCKKIVPRSQWPSTTEAVAR
jgi:hypothetical protein